MTKDKIMKIVSLQNLPSDELDVLDEFYQELSQGKMFFNLLKAFNCGVIRGKQQERQRRAKREAKK